MSSLLKRVLDLSSNKFVEACAGAGKTFALSKRYCAILDEFTKPDKNRNTDNRPGVQNILVITFTKKATAEIRLLLVTKLGRSGLRLPTIHIG